MKCVSKLVSWCVSAFLVGNALAADPDTNYWKGPDNGAWGADENWSLGHVPTESEVVNFTNTAAITVQVTGNCPCFCYRVYEANLKAPITFTGGGTVTASGTWGHYSKKPIVLDGTTLALNGRETLFYANVTLRNGAKLTSDGQLFHSWANKAEFLVEDGEISCGNLCYAAGPSKVTLKKGKIACTGFRESAKEHTGRCELTIDSGEFTCTGAFLLTNATAFVLNDGAVSIGGKMTIMDTASLALNGGAITNSQALTRAQKRLITENRGTALATLASGTAVDVIERDDEVLTFVAPFAAPNGNFETTNRATLVSDQPFAVRRFRYPSSTGFTAPLTLKLAKIIASDVSPFDTSNGNSRDFYIEGPLTLYPSVAAMSPTDVNKTTYVRVDGDMTIDTRDWNDPSVTRAMALRNIGSTRGNGALIVRGGGSFYMVQTYPETFREVSVEANTTFELGCFENVEYGPLNAERFVLGPSAVLKVVAGSNTLHAANVEIDPTARIEVTVPADFASGGKSILRDQCGLLGDISSQVTLTGEGAAGCSAVCMGGVLSVVKPVADVDGTYSQEWTGGAGNGNWTEPANWYNNTAPVKGSKTTVYAFGCADTVLNTDYDLSGAYLGRVVFRETAVKSFALTSSGERTFFYDGTWWTTAPSVYSCSSVPQYFGFKFRRTGAGNRFSFAAQDAPIVITSPTCYFPERGILAIIGDVRLSGTISYPSINLYKANERTVPRTLLTVLNGGKLTVTNQILAVDAGVSSAALAVRAGGTLIFKGLTADVIYCWTSAPTKHVIDGTLQIDAPYCGGADQVYGGSGDLRLAATRPQTAASSLTLSDTLTAQMTADWTTTADGADFPLTLKTASFSHPVLKLAANWTYGPASGATPESTAADRALVIARSSVLTLDAGGYAATFADPVAGEGKLAVTNGLVRLTGGTAELETLRLETDGVLELAGDWELGGIEAAGGLLRLADDGAVALSGDVNLDGLRLGFANGNPAHWTTILTAANVSGTPTMAERCDTRIVATADGMALQARRCFGTVLIVR